MHQIMISNFLSLLTKQILLLNLLNDFSTQIILNFHHHFQYSKPTVKRIVNTLSPYSKG